jgi:hypothetical protein
MSKLCCEAKGYRCGNDCKFNPSSDYYERPDEAEYNDVEPDDKAMFDGVFIGLRDIYGKKIKEGSAVKFKSRIYVVRETKRDREFEGIVKYNQVTCGFYIDRGDETSFRFGVEIYDTEVIEGIELGVVNF